MAYPDLLDKITEQFLSVLQRDADAIQQFAQHLFYYLVVIQLTLTGIWMSLMGAELRQCVTKFIGICFSFGFFYGLMQVGGQWVPDILNGFIDIGGHAGVQTLNPSSVLEQGLSIAGSIYQGVYLLGVFKRPFVTMMGLSCCLSVIIIYSFIAAELVIVLVKSYVLVALNALFFALGALDQTRSMTINYVNRVLGLGFQLLSLYLLIGVGQRVGEHWSSLTVQAAKAHDIMPMLVILASVIVYYMLIKHIPPFIAGLSGAGGFHYVSDEAVATTLSSGRKTMMSLHYLSDKLEGLYKKGIPMADPLARTVRPPPPDRHRASVVKR